jgi:hypothetical protein
MHGPAKRRTRVEERLVGVAGIAKKRRHAQVAGLLLYLLLMVQRPIGAPGAGMRPQRDGGSATFPLTGNLEDSSDGGAIPAWSASASTGPAHQPGAHALVAELSAMLRTLPLRLITSILALVACRPRALSGARLAHRRRLEGRAAHAVIHGTRHSGRRDQVPTKVLGRTIMPTRTVASLDKVASAA